MTRVADGLCIDGCVTDAQHRMVSAVALRARRQYARVETRERGGRAVALILGRRGAVLAEVPITGIYDGTDGSALWTPLEEV